MSPSATRSDFHGIVLGRQMYMYSYVQEMWFCHVYIRMHCIAQHTLNGTSFPQKHDFFLLLASKTVLSNLSAVIRTGEIRLAVQETDIAGLVLQVVVKSNVLSVYERWFLEKGHQRQVVVKPSGRKSRFDCISMALDMTASKLVAKASCFRLFSSQSLRAIACGAPFRA